MNEWSGWRVFFWVLFLSVVTTVGSGLLYLPTLLDLSEYQPEVVSALQKTFRCKVLVGHVHGELVPYPGLIIGPVVFVDSGNPRRVLASVRGVHVWISVRKLFSGHLQFERIRFASPRFMFHRELKASYGSEWTSLKFSRTIGPPAPGSALIDDWEVRNGQLELWDHTTTPVNTWILHPVNGSFEMSTQQGDLVASAPRFGRHLTMSLRYDGSEEFPLQAHLDGLEVSTLLEALHVDLPALDGSANLLVKARLEPTLEVQAILKPFTLAALNNTRLHGTAHYQKPHWSVTLQSGTTDAMALSVDGTITPRTWNVQGKISNYNSTIVQRLYRQAWLDRLEGPGSLDFSVQKETSTVPWNASVEGKNFAMAGSGFQIPTLSAQANSNELAITVDATTPQGGAAHVVWAHTGSADPTLNVTASAVTIRQVLEIFSLQSKTAPPPASEMNPFGYEPWRIQNATFQSILHPGSLDVQSSEVDLAGMHLSLTGSFGLLPNTSHAQIDGTLSNIPFQPTIESFFPPPSPISGTGALTFSLNVPLSSGWIQGLNGTLTVDDEKGILKLLKTAYRVVSVLNLGNYLSLRFPQLNAKGIVFDTVSGHLKFENGVLSTQDLFLKSPNMNVGAVGSLDLPGRSIHATLRLEMLRFLEDILRDVPLTHWIFKKPNKIFLPLVVEVKGPWSDVDVL